VAVRLQVLLFSINHLGAVKLSTLNDKEVVSPIPLGDHALTCRIVPKVHGLDQ
jgi:hypothetical protein